MPSTSIDCDVIAFRAKWVLVPEENASKQEAKASVLIHSEPFCSRNYVARGAGS